ncbi:DUF2975 domain-containing protein [Propioniciclava soli]|uniref:DUF2975 domain-containing protein n=1 Tax=Propioniciclava soli TaxID=2775081 RepID=UPI001E4612ED|nr:DUF2975 domain-containing protein [Propioniciclava soli]
MKRLLVTGVLRALLAGAFGVIALIQVVVLPLLSGEVARDLPAEAYMRWPILTFAILGLGCVQVGIVCTFLLLGLTSRDEVFTPQALRWVDGLTLAFLGGGTVCLATIVYQSFTVGGPPPWMFLLLCGVAMGVGLALLMRSLLVQATGLRTEREAVI